MREEKVLSLDPADGRCELVRKQLDEDDVGELLALLCGTPVVLVPLPEHLVEARRQRLVVDELSVLLRDLEGLRDEVGNVLPDEGVGVEVRSVDLLRQVCTEALARLKNIEQNAHIQARKGMTPAQR